MSELNFNAFEVEPASEYTPLPNGQYVAVIGESSVKSTKKGDGKLLELVLVVLEGEYANRKIWARLNIVNRNPDAQRIANGHLSSICRAVGVMRPADSTELHNIPLRVTVVCKPRGDGNGLTNEVTHFAPAEGAAGPAGAPSAPGAAAQSGPGAAAAPRGSGAASAPPSPPAAPPAADQAPW